jgi:catechol 2,3-dioxygenase-like lactoylglutathione lyase family enzyme
MLEQRITIITLGVKDLQQSTSFYETKFGWKRLAISSADISFYKLNGILLSLYPREKLADDAETTGEGDGFRGMTLAYNARTEAEVDTIINDLRQKECT